MVAHRFGAGWIIAFLALSAGAQTQADAGSGDGGKVADGGTPADGGTAADGGNPADGGQTDGGGGKPAFTAVALVTPPRVSDIPVLDIDAVIADDGSIVSSGEVAILVADLGVSGDAGTVGGGDSGTPPDGGKGGGNDGGSFGGGDAGQVGPGAIFAARFLGALLLDGDGGLSLLDGGSFGAPDGGGSGLAGGGLFGLTDGGFAHPCGGDAGINADAGCFDGATHRYSLWGATVQLFQGANQVSALAFDQAGRQATSPSAEVAVAGPPEVSFVQPPDGALLFNLQDIVAAASGTSLTSVALSAGDAHFSCAAASPAAQLTCTWADVEVAALCPGRHGCTLTLKATAVDLFGRSATAQRTAVIDPRFGILHPRQGAHVDERFELDVRPPPGAGPPQCTVGGRAVELRRARHGHFLGIVSTRKLADGPQPIDCGFAAADRPVASARIRVLLGDR